MNKTVGRLGAALLTIGLVTGLIGCSSDKDKVTKEMYEQAKKDVTLGCNLTLNDLESNMVKFTYKVYNPQSEKDIIEGIDLLKGILEEEEYRELRDTAKYDATKKSTIDNVVAKYSTKANNTDGMDKIYIEFTLNVDGLSQNKAIEFTFNPNNKIFKHTLWNSSVVSQ